MMVSILHISDLHRDPSHELSNQALLDSLEADRKKYEEEEPRIAPPSIAVVSGDLIYGVKFDHGDPTTELNRQNDQAHEFLAGLADSFFDGDRSRVVLLPGNHDVSFPATMASLEELRVNPTDATTKELVKQLWEQNSSIRWNWNTLSFWRIADADEYAKRLDDFRRLYNRFYDGLERRPYSLDPIDQFDIFDFSEENITVVAMSSCYHNDPLRRQGMIHPDCISKASRAIHGATFQGRLLIASWHHNTSGGPMAADYMDSDILQVLIDRGFSIGLHGHQHKAQFIDERFALGGKSKITVLSASTLCAGPHALPSGHRRGYNLLQIDTVEHKATLHQRSMLNDDFALPVWGPGIFPLTGTSTIQFDVQPPKPAATSAPLAAAEQELRAKNFTSARARLLPLKDVALARPLLLEALIQVGDFRSIVEYFVPPMNTAEAIHAMNAAWELRDRQTLRRILEMPNVVNDPDSTLRDLRERFNRRLAQ